MIIKNKNNNNNKKNTGWEPSWSFSGPCSANPRGEERQAEERRARVRRARGRRGTQCLPPAACWKKCFPTPAGERASKPADFLPFLIELKMGLFSSEPPHPTPTHSSEALILQVCEMPSEYMANQED